jgi:hypothetical protein
MPHNPHVGLRLIVPLECRSPQLPFLNVREFSQPHVSTPLRLQCGCPRASLACLGPNRSWAPASRRLTGRSHLSELSKHRNRLVSRGSLVQAISPLPARGPARRWRTSSRPASEKLERCHSRSLGDRGQGGGRGRSAPCCWVDAAACHSSGALNQSN